MKKAAAIIQVVIVSLLVVYGTICLYFGDFGGAFATFPFLLFFYVYVVARQKRQRLLDNDEGERDPEEK